MPDPVPAAAPPPTAALRAIGIAMGLLLAGGGGVAAGFPRAAAVGIAAGTALAFGGFLRLGMPVSARRTARLAWGTAIGLAVAFGIGLADGPAPSVARLWLGLPVSTAVVLLGLALVPAIVLPLAFAAAHASSDAP